MSILPPEPSRNERKLIKRIESLKQYIRTLEELMASKPVELAQGADRIRELEAELARLKTDHGPSADNGYQCPGCECSCEECNYPAVGFHVSTCSVFIKERAEAKMERHAFSPYNKAPHYCGWPLKYGARCGMAEGAGVHLSDDIVDDRRVPFLAQGAEVPAVRHNVFPKQILDDVLVLLAGQKYPTPEKGFTGWDDALSSLKRFIRERTAHQSVSEQAEQSFRLAHLMEGRDLTTGKRLTPTAPSASEQAQRAAGKIAAYLDRTTPLTLGSAVSEVAAIIEEEMGKTAGEDPQKTLPADKS